MGRIKTFYIYNLNLFLKTLRIENVDYEVKREWDELLMTLRDINLFQPLLVQKLMRKFKIQKFYIHFCAYNWLDYFSERIIG